MNREIEMRVYADPHNIPPSLPFWAGDDITPVLTSEEVIASEANTPLSMLERVVEKINCPGCDQIRPFNGAVNVYHHPGMNPGHQEIPPEDVFDALHDRGALRRRWRKSGASMYEIFDFMQSLDSRDAAASEEIDGSQPTWFDYHAAIKVTCLCGVTAIRHITQDNQMGVWEYPYAHPEERADPASGLRWWRITPPSEPKLTRTVNLPDYRDLDAPVAPINVFGADTNAQPDLLRLAMLEQQDQLAHHFCPDCLARAWNGRHFRPYYTLNAGNAGQWTLTLTASCRHGHSPNHGPHGDRVDRYPGSYRCHGGQVQLTSQVRGTDITHQEPVYLVDGRIVDIHA